MQLKILSIKENPIDPSDIPESGAFFPFDYGKIGEEHVGEVRLFVHGPVKFNPHHDSASKTMEAWMREMNFFGSEGEETLTKFLSANYPALMAYVYPDVDGKKLGDATLLGGWLFVHDDLRDRPGVKHSDVVEMNKLLMKVLDDIDVHVDQESPYLILANGLKDMLRRYQEYGDITFFKNELKAYLETNLWESQNRTEKVIPSLCEYMRNRRFTSAVGAAFELGYLLSGVTITREERDASLFKRASESGCQAVCFINDVVSLKKEIWEDHAENLVVVNKYQNNILTWKDTLQYTHDRNYVAEVKAFLKIKAGNKYEKVIDDWIKGSTVWSLPGMKWGTNRYAGWANKEVCITYDQWRKE